MSLLHDAVSASENKNGRREGGKARTPKRHPLTIYTHFTPNRNHFPPHYAENISEQNLPVELFAQYTTVEYELQVPPAGTGRGREGGRGVWDVRRQPCGVCINFPFYFI